MGAGGRGDADLQVLPEPVDDLLFSPATAANALPPHWPPASNWRSTFALIGGGQGSAMGARPAAGGEVHRAAGWLPEIAGQAGPGTVVLLSMFKWERRKGWCVPPARGHFARLSLPAAGLSERLKWNAK